jgi:hypothetical protein
VVRNTINNNPNKYNRENDKETLERLKLKLWGMARTYETSLENEKLLALSTDEMIGMLVEANGMTVRCVTLSEGYAMPGSVISLQLKILTTMLTATWTGDSCCALPSVASSANMRTLLLQAAPE